MIELSLLRTLLGGGVESQAFLERAANKRTEWLDRLREIQSKKARTNSEFARSIGWKPESYQKVLDLRVRPSVALLQAVCRAYKVSPAWLLLGEGEMERQPAKSVPSDSAEVARLVQIIVSQGEEIKELRAASLRPQAPTPDMEALLIRQAERSTAAPAPDPLRPVPSPGTAKTRR